MLLCTLSAVLVYPVFIPNLADIWNFDEAYYMNNGRLLTEGEFPVYASNPAVAFFWALFSAPFLDSPYWMLYGATAGRLVLFALMWLGTIALACEVLESKAILAAIGLLIVTAMPARLLDNSSDAFYAVFSTLALWQTLRAVRNGAFRNLAYASGLTALAALSRNDGLVLVFVLLLLSVYLGLRSRALVSFVGAALVPPAVIVGGYVLLAGVFTGDFTVGTSRRSYDAFEQGEGVTYSEFYPGKNPYLEGYSASRRLYGSPEENKFSVMTAVRRNPRAFVRRVLHAAKKLPGDVLNTYGFGVKGLGVILLLLALRGIIDLLSRRRFLLVVVLLGWSANLFVYFVTFFREGYFLLSFPGVLVLGALGIRGMHSAWNARSERYTWSVALGGTTLLGIATDTPSLVGAPLVLLLGLWALWITFERLPESVSARTRLAVTSLVVLLLIGIQNPLASKPWGTPKLRELGRNGDERAALCLRESLPKNSPVGTYSLATVVLAQMHHVPMHAETRDLQSSDELYSWIIERGIKAIYIDDLLQRFEPKLWGQIQELIGSRLSADFDDGSGSHMVLVVLPGGSQEP